MAHSAGPEPRILSRPKTDCHSALSQLAIVISSSWIFDGKMQTISRVTGVKKKHPFAPWCITDTVYSDRKNIFCLAENSEFHIGTLVSGSRDQLDRFEATLPLIRHAPDLAHALSVVVALLKRDISNFDDCELEKIKHAEGLLSYLTTPYVEG